VLGLFFLAFYFYRHRHEFSSLIETGFILIFAGAISNIFDRLYLGYVRDFLDLGLGFTFNMADVFVVMGLLIILFTQSKPKVIIEV
jgi:signal peptidase II